MNKVKVEKILGEYAGLCFSDWRDYTHTDRRIDLYDGLRREAGGGVERVFRKFRDEVGRRIRDYLRKPRDGV